MEETASHSSCAFHSQSMPRRVNRGSAVGKREHDIVNNTEGQTHRCLINLQHCCQYEGYVPKKWKIPIEKKEEGDESEPISWWPVILDLQVEGDEVFTNGRVRKWHPKLVMS